MNGTIKHILYMAAALLTLCFCGCADEAVVDTKPQKEGTLLNMYVSTTPTTRLAELGSPNNMNDTKEDKYKHKDVGLYIYYEDDYTAGDLSKPYIRNLRCTVKDNKLIAESEKDIYIYDRMTIVAFYPYNEDMSKEENYFTTKQDEKAYPITESDYSKQYYIPYRAEKDVNPTNAYKITLDFSPQQTCKVEVVLVADSKDDFPTSPVDFKNDEAIKLLPTIDRYTDGTNEWKSEKGDLRENWVDAIEDFPSGKDAEPVGGKYVRRYTAYVWKSGENDRHHDNAHKHHDNILKAGDQLFVSDKLILTVPYTVNLNEQTVYRYGYNLNTGEIFIPTSDRLVYDATSLKDVSVNSYRVYQVCDIDLAGQTWTPKTAFKGTYDGGGHKIMNLTLDATVKTAGKGPAKQSFGLFESISSESTLMNIDLVNPNITVDFSTNKKDTCYVGALCGLINPELTDEEKRAMLGAGLPPELSETVKKALIEDMLAEFDNSSTCYIRGCKVTNPIINVTGENVRVGGLCGGAGNQKQKAEIKDSYVWQDSETNSSGDAIGIAVNTETEYQMKYTTAYAAGFCGIVSNGIITNCYTTMEKVHAYVKEETPASGNNPVVTTAKDVAQGFYNPAPKKEKVSVSVSGCYTVKEDTHAGVENFKNAWPNNWPLFANDLTVSNGGSDKVDYTPGAYPAYTWTDSWYDMGTKGSSYPTLVWEHPLIKKL